MNETLRYYEDHAASFCAGTVSVDFSAVQERFLARLPPGSLILDFGCGAGRDAKAFLERGFRVEAADGSAALCRMASLLTGLEVRQMLFDELDEVERYDGIWACASILHLPKAELAGVLARMARALKPGGAAYASFKYGTFEGMRNGRHFTDLTLESFTGVLAAAGGLSIGEHWVSADVRPGRGNEKWLNLILRRP